MCLCTLGARNEELQGWVLSSSPGGVMLSLCPVLFLLLGSVDTQQEPTMSASSS